MKLKTFKIGNAEIASIGDRKHQGALIVGDWMRKPFKITPGGIAKALPRDKEEKVKKTKTDGKATSKKGGKNGKTRYGYAADKQQKKDGKKAPGKGKAESKSKPASGGSAGPQQQQEQSGADPIAVPRQPTPKSVDPQHVANQIQIPVTTLQHIAARFTSNPKLGGRDGFIKFMGSRLKEFAEKHKLEGDYFGLLFDALTGATNVASKV